MARASSAWDRSSTSRTPFSAISACLAQAGSRADDRGDVGGGRSLRTGSWRRDEAGLLQVRYQFLSVWVGRGALWPGGELRAGQRLHYWSRNFALRWPAGWVRGCDRSAGGRIGAVAARLGRAGGYN